ncbi:hypothetical protein [Mucilaginibacter lacusdianchii]|uniref:hypothetical protein n=1 Tax=Mucilaginibacter lacusdianchii TaxID=2684211 RepID=UPI00131AFD7E|nr:hypothetical protein [Mucilaginibacter sp. JXJ CY 39]
MPITEKDIITFLQEKAQFHKTELKRIEDIIAAITQSTFNKSFVPHSELSAHVTVHEDLERKAPVRVKSHKVLQVPENFRPGLSISHKISYALNVIHSGFKEDIAEQITLLQPGLSKEFVIRQISTVLCELKAQNLLNTTKIGRKLWYSLPNHTSDTEI